MRNRSLILIQGMLLLLAAGCGGASSSEAAPPNSPKFIVCESTYALCTGAPCTPIPGDAQDVSCACIVQTGYSAGLTQCQPPTFTPDGGLQVLSRYFPIRSYASCSNSRPWANCLDFPCIVDPTNSLVATCTCAVEQNQGAYIAVNHEDQYDAASCTTGILSSATLTAANGLTAFLKHNSKLPPFKVKVFQVPQSQGSEE